MDDQPQITLRDTLESAVDAADAGTLPTPEERARDEAGRFARKEELSEPVVAPPVEVAPDIPRPTTWKKEYLPLWDKLVSGAPLTPEEAKKVATYSNQRESEYKTGVSTYKAEAMQSKEVMEAISPFLQSLQEQGATPSSWIKDVGQAHYVLLKGTPDQKLQLFHALAQRYGVPMAAIQQQGQGGNHPLVTQLMQQISDLKNSVSGVNTWKQSLEMQQLQAEVQKVQGDTQNYPHFEAVREPMAQLLESGAARDLPTAYKMAVRMDDNLYQGELDRLVSSKQSVKTNAVAKAKSQAISPKSSTPSGSVTNSGTKDRRAELSEAFDAHDGGRV